jgi:molybdopterin/thiamine biosynthesis adenylyltransferase
MAEFLGHEGAFRGEEIVKKRSGAKVTLLGAGALGSWLCDLLARQGYGSLTIVDMEKVDHDNFGTQNYGKTDSGRAKAVQSAQNIFRRIGVKVVGLSKKVTASNIRTMIKGQDLIVDLFDNAESRELVRSACAEMGIECLHAGMGTMGYFEVIWNERYKVAFDHEEDADAPCDYPLAANLVTLCVGATAEVINAFVDSGKKVDVDFWLGKFRMNLYEPK